MIMIAGYLLWQVSSTDQTNELATTVVDRGDVKKIVSVSGIMRASNTAFLAFPSNGIVSKVNVKEGDMVEVGTVLATIGIDTLLSDRASAVADLRLAEADRNELLNGVTKEAKEITDTKLAIATADQERIKEAGVVAVENAKRALLSTDLLARSEDSDEDAVPPAITGTYRCDQEGDYRLSVYNSNSQSGYSVRISGLETGTYPVSFLQPTPFGDCGLFAQFTEGENYGNSNWTITIPNKTSASYITNLNTLNKTKQDTKNANEAATEAVTLATNQKTLEEARPRDEALTRANARVDQARARISRIDSEISDKSIIAPFDGTITTVDILPGETAGLEPVVTILATNAFELVARVPEIDITKVAVGQSAEVIFDAKTDTKLKATANYTAQLPIQIDGVAYFEVKFTIDNPPSWIRGGLNADIDIIIGEEENAIRVPNRYLSRDNEVTTVQTLTDNKTIATTTVEELFVGNDGYVAISGIEEGTIIIAP